MSDNNFDNDDKDNNDNNNNDDNNNDDNNNNDDKIFSTEVFPIEVLKIFSYIFRVYCSFNLLEQSTIKSCKLLEHEILLNSYIFLLWR